MALTVKNAVMALRVTESRKLAYMEHAGREGRRLSEWLRDLADRRIAESEASRLSAPAEASSPRRAWREALANERRAVAEVSPPEGPAA